MNSSFSPNFPIDLNEDHHHHHHEDYAAASSSSSISYPFFISPSPQDSPYYHPLHHQDHEVENFYASHGGSSTDHQNESGNKLFVCKKEDRENGSVKWMSSKMRLMRKMMKSTDQTVGNTSSDQNSNSLEKGQSSISMDVDDNTTKNLLNNNNSTIRVCADCNTTKTPLWRSGPRGPKSLCNACGIRQRKARRALAAAQESGGNGQAIIFDSTDHSAAVKSTHKVIKNKDQRTANNSHLPFKKRCKFGSSRKNNNNNNNINNNINNNNNNNNNNKVCFEDLSSLILSKYSSEFQQVFPQDEKEAAVLLMALSYGLVRG